jgi:DNA polymerase III epsilon subunit-like protein
VTKLCFVDVEVTGLDPERHEIWEVGIITRQDNGEETSYHEFLQVVNLPTADPFSLQIGGYHSRHPNGYDYPFEPGEASYQVPKSRSVIAHKIARLTHHAHLVGAVISFDEERLRKLLLRNGLAPSWHYHIVDVEALAAGYLGMAPPWDSEVLSRCMNIDPQVYARHTALGDATWARDLYDAVI